MSRFLPSAPVLLTQKLEDKYCFLKAKSSSVPELHHPGRRFVPAFAAWLSVPSARWQLRLMGEPGQATSRSGLRSGRWGLLILSSHRMRRGAAVQRAELLRTPPHQRFHGAVGAWTCLFRFPPRVRAPAACAGGGAAVPAGWEAHRSAHRLAEGLAGTSWKPKPQPAPALGRKTAVSWHFCWKQKARMHQVS